MLAHIQSYRAGVRSWLRRYWVPGGVAMLVLFGLDLLNHAGPALAGQALLTTRLLLLVGGMALVSFWLAATLVHEEERRQAAGIRSLDRARHRRLSRVELPDDR